MPTLIHSLLYSLSITAPIFVVIGLGAWLRHTEFINDNFVEVSSRLVFNITIPILLFLSISRTSIDQAANLPLIGVGLLGTLLAYLLLELLATHLVADKKDRGVVVQGGFRANTFIIGLAYCVNAYGDAVLGVASLYVGLLGVLHNVLTVVTLNRSLGYSGDAISTIKDIVSNPLIISILLALIFSALPFELPSLVVNSGEYFSRMTVPLALLCAGAGLNFRALRKENSKAALAACFKLIVVPLLLIGLGIAMGFRGQDLGVLALMSSAPTAAASFIMVRSMGGNAGLAANIIVLTTLASLLTTSLIMFLLRGLGLL